DVRIDVAQDELAAGRLHFLVERDELAQRGAGEVLDVAKVQQDLAPAELIDEAEQVFTDLLDILLIQNFAINELNNGHIAAFFHFEATTTGLRRGHASS